MKKPRAVLISDIHYNLNTLPLADASLRQAVAKANDLKVPLIVAGDLHDTKANLRAECMNAMLATFSEVTSCAYVIRGNHCSLNEKSTEHALSFLSRKPVYVGGSYVDICDDEPFISKDICLFPYHHDLSLLRERLKQVPKGSTVIMHQGLNGTASGEYIQDKTALNLKDVAGLRVISGHYHTRQTIQLPDGGVWDYIGNPYTLNFAEATDPEKGFQVLYDDGSLEFVPTNLRKHIVFTLSAKEVNRGSILIHNPGDIVKLKISGTKQELAKLNRETIIPRFGIEDAQVKIEFLPTDEGFTATEKPKNLTQAELLDSVIDSSTDISKTESAKLKTLWRGYSE